MEFYKVKIDAAKPTPQTVTINTNTDYIIGVEAYVNDKKIQLLPDSIKLVGEEHIADTSAGPAYVQDANWIASTTGTNPNLTNIFRFRGQGTNFYINSNIKSNDNGTTWYKAGKEDLKLYKGDERLTTGDVETTWLTWTSTADNKSYRIFSPAKSAVVDAADDVLYYAIEDVTDSIYLDSYKMPYWDMLSSATYTDAETSQLVNLVDKFDMRFRFTEVFSPDTNVNGIAAWTFKADNTAKSKVYKISVKQDSAYFDWNLSASTSPDYTFISADNYGQYYNVNKPLTFKASFYQIQNEKENYLTMAEDYTWIKALAGTNGKEWFTDPTVMSQMNGVISYRFDNKTFKVMNCPGDTVVKTMEKPADMPCSLIIDSNYKYVKEIDIPAGAVMTFPTKGGFSPTPRSTELWINQTINTRNNLTVVEMDTSKGDVKKSLTAEETKKLIDDTVGQFSTVNLSGTFDDDSTFSYNFVIKN